MYVFVIYINNYVLAGVFDSQIHFLFFPCSAWYHRAVQGGVRWEGRGGLTSARSIARFPGQPLAEVSQWEAGQELGGWTKGE